MRTMRISYGVVGSMWLDILPDWHQLLSPLIVFRVLWIRYDEVLGGFKHTVSQQILTHSLPENNIYVLTQGYVNGWGTQIFSATCSQQTQDAVLYQHQTPSTELIHLIIYNHTNIFPHQKFIMAMKFWVSYHNANWNTWLLW